ncbi:hypothetical protein IPA_00870 [Ignicoccus pacificus DSM 13166]|uniref:Uncharacterized protein n=1 Tax=Ignicoccus pacificus DSM 13166 TaxID=940294 RepID=A0A977KAD6_9CREN|nr:hypothetical protein IPA_00870 [Ignicoccus pacificus DSM 13166]
MALAEAARKLAIANLLLLYSFFLSLFNITIIQVISTALGIYSIYLQYKGWSEMEKVKKEYSPGRLSVIETVKGMVFSIALSSIALILLRVVRTEGALYLALALSTASLLVAIYYSVKAIIHYLKALRAVDKDYGTKLFVGGLLAVLGAPLFLTAYMLGIRSLLVSLPALIGLSMLAVQFWQLSSKATQS